MASISKQSKETQDRHRKLLADLLKRPENHECMDCRARNPTWASINLGVFVCIRCSGLHRQVGVHITKVRSCTMDLWDPEQIAFMQTMGNGKGKALYEALLPPDYGKPSESEDSQLVLQWIRTKYEKKRYIHPNGMAGVLQQFASTKSGATSSTAPSTTTSQLSTMTMAKPRASRQKASLASIEDGCSFDQFMSPAVQSPRGTFPTEEEVSAGGGGGASAFSFIDAPTTTANGGSAFSFVSEQPPISGGGGGAPSAFDFMGNDSSAPSGSPLTGGGAATAPPPVDDLFEYIAQHRHDTQRAPGGGGGGEGGFATTVASTNDPFSPTSITPQMPGSVSASPPPPAPLFQPGQTVDPAEVQRMLTAMQLQMQENMALLMKVATPAASPT